MASDQLEGFVPPEEDKVVIDRRLGSIPHRAPEMREDLNNWKQRFDYALAVMAGSQPAEWLDQLGAREIVGEAGAEGGMMAVPGVRRFPTQPAMRPGATIAPAGVVPFTRPFEGIVPKDKLNIPEPANVNVETKTGWREVPYEPKNETHQFLFDTHGRPVAAVSPAEHIPGLPQLDDPGHFINFLDPAGKGDAYSFVGDTFILDDLSKAKKFASEAVETGKFGKAGKVGEMSPINELYTKYLDEQSKRRAGFVRPVSPEGKIVDKAAAKDMETSITDLRELLALKDTETSLKRGAAELDKFEAATAKQAAEFRAADAERRRGLFKEVEGGKKEGPELVTAAVIETPDGKRLRGYSHFDAMTKNWDEYIKHDAEKMKGSLFETSTGRLINKDEALALMDKTGQKRLGLSTKETGLMSEDVPDLLKGENERVMRELGIDPNAPHPYDPLKYVGDAYEPIDYNNPEFKKFHTFMNTLSAGIDPEKWKRFIESQPLSQNIEDRRMEHDSSIFGSAIEGLRRMMLSRDKSSFEDVVKEEFRKNPDYKPEDTEEFRGRPPLTDIEMGSFNRRFEGEAPPRRRRNIEEYAR